MTIALALKLVHEPSKEWAFDHPPEQLQVATRESFPEQVVRRGVRVARPAQPTLSVWVAEPHVAEGVDVP
jgi:hypothetical protein